MHEQITFRNYNPASFSRSAASSDEIPTLSRRAKLKSIFVCGALLAVVFTLSLLQCSDKSIQNMPHRIGNNISVPQHSGGEKDTSDRIGDNFVGFIAHNEIEMQSRKGMKSGGMGGGMGGGMKSGGMGKNTFTRKGPKGVTSLTSTAKRQRDKSVRRALISPHGYERHSYHYKAQRSPHGYERHSYHYKAQRSPHGYERHSYHYKASTSRSIHG